MDTWELMEGPLMTPRQSPSRRMDEAIDRVNHELDEISDTMQRIAHDLVTIEDALKLGAELGERRNTLNVWVAKFAGFTAKLNRVLARGS